MGPDAPLLPGTVVAEQFRVLRPLAAGGMGAVYVVEQLGTGKIRALKVIQPALLGSRASRERFAREARVSAAIESDHVVEVVAAGVDAAQAPWIAMELLRGEDLAHAVARHGPLAAPDALEVLAQVCDALAAAHRAGVVHRDLKPENVFLAIARRRGVPYTVKVLDFGIAKVLREGAASAQTQPLGSPLWMSPEQTDAGAAIGPPTDVWALGLLAFWLLTARSYWLGAATVPPASLMALMREVLTAPLAPASERARALGAAALLPAGFDAWFARCVAREPRHRFPDVPGAFGALGAVLEAAPTGATADRLAVCDATPRDALDAVAPPTPHPGPDAPGSAPGGTLTSDAIGHDPTPAAGGEAHFATAATLPAAATPATPAAPRRVRTRTVALAAAVTALCGGATVALWIRRGTRSAATRPPPAVSTPAAGELRAQVRAATPGVHDCYERSLAARGPTVAGSLRVHFTIDRDGRVQDVMTGTSDGGLDVAPELRVCVERVMRAMAFAPRPTPTEVTYPFVFRADDAGPPAH